MARDDLGVLILSHGRPDAVNRTLKALRRTRYTGPWWIILDDEDDTADAYRTRWGADRIITFSKVTAAAACDAGDNHPPGPVVLYARNAADGIAASLGLAYYFVLDDDYTYFAHRLVRDGVLSYAYTYRLDDVLDACVEFLETSGALTVAFAQGGDFIGGKDGAYRRQVLRKAMNTFLVRTGSPIGFVGRLNEDTTTYVWRGGQGDLFLTLTDMSIEQPDTQEQEGGLTSAYLDLGTYVKSFYSVMWAPSAVKIATLGENAHRVHHHVNWNHAVPRIVSGRHKKPAGK